MRRPGILVALILAVGIAGTVVALKSHESNAEFVLQQQALALRFGADLKLRDVAGVLGEGESAVEGRIYRALGKLRENLSTDAADSLR